MPSGSEMAIPTKERRIETVSAPQSGV
jgi:hypothetical protein